MRNVVLWLLVTAAGAVAGCSGAFRSPSQSENGGLSGNGNGNDPSGTGTPSGSALVDVLASSFAFDRQSATADGADAILVTIALLTPIGTPAVGVPITVTLSGTGNVITPDDVESDAEGIAQVALRSTKAEAKMLGVRVQQGALGSTALSFVAGPVAVARSTLVATPPLQRAGGAHEATISVTLRDAANNPVAGANVSLTIAGAGNTLVAPGGSGVAAAPAGVTDAAGVFRVAVRSSVAESKALAASVDGATIAGNVRFVGEWFLASGAPFGSRFACAVPAGNAAARTWHVVTEHGAFVSEGERFAHLPAAPIRSPCRSLAIDESGAAAKLYAAFDDGQARELLAGSSGADFASIGDAQANMRAIFVDARNAVHEVLLAAEGTTEVRRLAANKLTWIADDAGIVAAGPPAAARAFAVNGATIFVATSGGVFSRTGAATTWALVGSRTDDVNALVIAVEGNTQTLYAATAAGVWRRTLAPVAGAWEDVSAGLPNVECAPGPCAVGPVRAIAIDGSATPARLFVATEEAVSLPAPFVRSRVFTKLTNDTSWTATIAQPAAADERVEGLSVDGGHVFASVERRGLFSFDPALATAAPLGAALPAYPIDALAYDPGSEALFAAMRDGVYKSADFGERWAKVALGTDEAPVSLAIDTTREPAALIVGTAASAPSQSFRLFESVNAGASFSDVTGTLSMQTTVPLVAATYAHVPRTLVVSDASQLFLRASAPASFTSLVLETPPFPAGPVVIHSLDEVGGALVAGTDAGAFMRTQAGAQSRLGGAGFLRAVRRVAKDSGGALWFATDQGLFSAANAASDVTLPATEPARSFVALAGDPMGHVFFAAAAASAALPILFRFLPGGTPAPVAATFASGASPRALTVASKLGAKAPAMVFVSFDGTGGLHASMYE
ncbi:MAG: Ig-like domain-containing protein [Deltaproteobacteria bacterium]|nr:Ig-like domain-containing protein [Deltaproteobacteria bacterium]